MFIMKATLGIGVLVVLLVSHTSFASDIYVFPSRGQTDAQMDKDKYSCHQWASQQSGYDPMSPPPSSGGVSTPAYRPGRDVLGGAAKGAVVAGIADGDAGKGAAVGALGGGIFGGMRHQRKVDSVRQQQAAATSGLQNDYRRAYSACLEGKGYTVR